MIKVVGIQPLAEGHNLWWRLPCRCCVCIANSAVHLGLQLKNTNKEGTWSKT